MLERAQYRQDAFIMLENFVTQVGCPPFHAFLPVLPAARPCA